MKTTVLNGTVHIEPIEETAPIPLNFILTLIISFILSLVFAIFEIIGLCRLAKTDSLKEAFNFKTIFVEFKKNWVNLLIGIIIMAIISILIGMIFSIINLSFGFGIIISLIGYAYLTILNHRFFGLLYSS